MGQTVKQGLVFNIQRYSVHDGPGIRTIVFLKGCPLHCPWCSNPEGMVARPQLSHNPNLCRRCGRCTRVCPYGAITQGEDGQILLHPEKCTLCGTCAKACPVEALKLFGGLMTVEEVLENVAKDEAFYRRSGGGLTVSGGDPLASPEFLEELLRTAKEKYQLNTAIETSLYAPWEKVERVLPYLDNLFTDIKLIDSRRHQEVVGVPNEPILENIRSVVQALPAGASMTIRFPMIPTINDDEENIRGIARFLKSLPKQLPIEVLPYHEFGRAKYESLRIPYPLAGKGIQPPEQEQVQHVESLFQQEGVATVHT